MLSVPAVAIETQRVYPLAKVSGVFCGSLGPLTPHSSKTLTPHRCTLQPSLSLSSTPGEGSQGHPLTTCFFPLRPLPCSA